MTDDLDPIDAAPGDGTAAEFAASAWADGIADPAERALVESDPSVRLLAERMRDVAAATAQVPTPSPDATERSLAAALAAFDELHAPVARRSGTRADRFRPVLAFAAAVLAIGVVGAVVTSGIRSTGGDDSVAVAPADPPADAFRTSDDDAGADDTEAGDVATAEAANPEAADAQADDGADGDAGATMLSAPDGAPLAAVAIDDAGALAAYATEVLRGDDPRPETSEPSPCPDVSTDVIGWATYGGAGVVVVLVESADGSDAVALDPGSCAEVLRADLEPPPRR